jgi:hypothetical protein
LRFEIMCLLWKCISSVINETVCFVSLLGHLFVMMDDKKRYFGLPVSTYLNLICYIESILRMLMRECIVWECLWEGWFWEVFF